MTKRPARRTGEGDLRPDRGFLVEAPSVSIEGAAFERLAVISRAALVLQLRIGSLDDEARTGVLVPITDMTLFGNESTGDSPEEPKQLLSMALTLENVAFVIYDLSDDFRFVCDQLRRVSEGAIKPEPARISNAREMLEATREKLGECIEVLDSMAPRIGSGSRMEVHSRRRNS